MPGHSKIIITTIITIIITDYYHENLSSVAGILLLALHESFLFHNSETEGQILFLLYRKGKDLKEFASSPHSLWSLGSGTAFFPCFSSSKIHAHSLFHFPIPFLFCIKYNIFYPVLYGGPICFPHVLCVK